VERRIISRRGYSVNDRRLLLRPSRTGKSERKAAVALTKEALWVIVLLSSLGVWAAVWAAAASMASAWLQ
jgi:hypothetical protein